jgi:hypothetical protein
MIVYPIKSTGQITKQTTVIYQQKKIDPAIPKKIKVKAST